MAYPIAIPVILRPTNVGLELRAELVHPDGTIVAQLAGTTVEHGDGQYMWYSDQIPNGFVGAVRFYVDDEFKAATTINLIDEVASVISGVSSWDELVDDHLDPGTFGELIASIRERLGAAEVIMTSPISTTGIITIIAGDDYKEANGREIRFEDVGGSWPTLTTETPITMTGGRGRNLFSAVGRVVEVGGEEGSDPPRVVIEIEGENTRHVAPNRDYGYAVKAEIGTGNIVTLATGKLVVREGFNL
jgi:hypothetical protein